MLSKTKVPVSAVVVDSTVFPPESRSSTVTPGSPSSDCSTTPDFPPPGLKSLQTTPVMPPDFGCGTTACFALLGTVSGEIPVRPSRATLPGWRVVCSTKPFCGDPVRFDVEGCASGRGPGGLNASWTARKPALTAPICGSSWYITRQITPAAKSEIAIGMKTTVLKATDQRIRSVRTANTRPIAVTIAGTTAIQIALFLIAVWVTVLVKISL